MSAQRQWALSDSTHYGVGGDTTLIASRKQLYRALPGDTVLLQDFTDLTDDDLYIRDVDHWSSSDFYVVVGSRYIGFPTRLYHSIDAGENWAEDQSFFAATEEPSINQMTIVGDTAFIFNGYYTSEVLRSYDHGSTWERWFQSLIAHYYGLIPCGESAFIYGMVGDAFQPAMWQVPDSLWADEDTFFWSGCHNGGTPGCQYSPSIYYADVVEHFTSTAAALCATMTIQDESPADWTTIFPNPATDRLLMSDRSARIQFIADVTGRSYQAVQVGGIVDISHLPPGSYVLHASTAKGPVAQRFLKE